MKTQVLRLFPAPTEQVFLQGLYLGLELHREGTARRPFVYANFLSSLDGRIALEDAQGTLTYVPKSLTSPNDFRLFLELAAQADCLITHGGYLRALQRGSLGNILQVGAREDAADLARWRLDSGLSPQPAVVVASASLDFAMPESIRNFDQVCYIATGERADPQRVAYWHDQGYEVLFAGAGLMVEGAALVRLLGERGLKCVYLIAGPHMLDTMIRDGQLSRLFQTVTHQLMGGSAFRTLSVGPPLGALGRLSMRSLYYDASSPEETGQWFAQFDCRAVPH